MKKVIILLIVSLTFLAGCVTNDVSYTPPRSTSLGANTITVNKPFDEAWKNAVKNLGSNFFVINNMDKESGFINVSYSGDPEKYIDGGELYYMVENLRGKREYRFPASRAFSQYEVFTNGVLVGCERKLYLEGRINIVISKESDESSSISVNTRYVLTQTISGRDVMGNVLHPDIQTLSLNTGGSVTNRGGTVYKANGVLEREIIDIITN